MTTDACEQLIMELLGERDSLYAQLSPRASACRPELGQLDPLAPCSEVDRALGRLVAVIQGDYGTPTQPGAREERALRAQLLQRLQRSPELRARAHTLRLAAGLAEHALERHWSARLLQQLSEAKADAAPAPAGPARVRALAWRLGAFPYLRNYLQLTRAELSLLARPARVLLPPAPRSSPRATERLTRAARLPPWPERTLAVCGCGPLPLSGLLLHAATGARVLLLDNDARALGSARDIVHALERLRVLPPGAVEAHEDDAARLASLPRADLLLVASLVDEPAKRALAHRLHAEPHPGLCVLFRSARELSAELAYPPVPTHAIAGPSLPLCGLSVPEHQSHGREPCVQVKAPRAVLNTSELYLSLPLSAAERQVR